MNDGSWFNDNILDEAASETLSLFLSLFVTVRNMEIQ